MSKIHERRQKTLRLAGSLHSIKLLGDRVAFPETNIELQLPYRKHLKVGDVFRLRYPGERYFLGQVSSLNAKARHTPGIPISHYLRNLPILMYFYLELQLM